MIACPNQKSVDYMVESIKELDIKGQRFRAWKRGENSLPNLVTLILTPPIGRAFKDDEIWPLFMAQNMLEGGKCGVPRFYQGNKGHRTMKVPISNDLALQIRSLGGKAAIGMHCIKVHCRKDESKI